jgi:cell division protein FtsL
MVPPGGGPVAAPGPVDQYGGGGGETAFRDDAKVVKTGTLSVEVERLDETLKKARAAIVALGGYVSGSDESNAGDRTQATIVYRVPADRWDDALDAIRGLAVKVVGEQTNAVEVTGQVLDLDARIRNLQATEASLQAIMEKAVKISDVLEVQRELTVVREQIEQLSTQKAHLEDQADLGTLSVYFTVPVLAVTETTQGWDPAAEVDRAIASLVGMLQGVASIGIWLLIVGLPILVVVGLLGVIVAVVLRRMVVGRRAGGGGLPPLMPPTTPSIGSASPAAPET